MPTGQRRRIGTRAGLLDLDVAADSAVDLHGTVRADLRFLEPGLADRDDLAGADPLCNGLDQPDQWGAQRVLGLANPGCQRGPSLASEERNGPAVAEAIEQTRGGMVVGHARLGRFGQKRGSVAQQVYDGDAVTVEAEGNLGVRFLGIDAPEVAIPPCHGVAPRTRTPC